LLSQQANQIKAYQVHGAETYREDENTLVLWEDVGEDLVNDNKLRGGSNDVLSDGIW
jgi:hypothetical protein